MPRETHKSNVYNPGDYWTNCAICGFDYLRSDLKKNYNNLLVCDKDYEEEHIQDLNLPTIKEKPFDGETNTDSVDNTLSTVAMVFPSRST